MYLPTYQQLVENFLLKHGKPEEVGWAPRRRFRFKYFYPADFYEVTVKNCVTTGMSWLDVGGGHQILPENPQLAKALVQRCSKVTAVDPSENVLRNELVHEKHRVLLEEFLTNEQFDIATMRMVVEHVADTHAFVTALSRLLKHNGLAIVFTVNAFSPLTLISRLVPFNWHHPIKRLFWGGDEEDTFPVQYRMNTRAKLKKLFNQNGFVEIEFARLDDLSTFGRLNLMNFVELVSWKAIRSMGLAYPENCLLGVYRKDRL